MAEEFKIYQPPNEEDEYVPPGRRKYDRNELRPPEDEIKLGPPIIDNDDIYRQQFAIKETLSTLRDTLQLTDVNSK